MPHVDIVELEKNFLENAVVAYLLVECYPCQTVEKYLDEIKKENENVALIKYKIKEDEEAEFSKRNKIDLYPVILIYKDGVLKRRREGYLNKEEIQNLIF